MARYPKANEPGRTLRPPDETAAETPPDAKAPEAAARIKATLPRSQALRRDPDALRRSFENGAYPYSNKMRRASYEARKAALQAELLKAQRWVKETDQKIALLFEGRDAAGKGGTIKRFMEYLKPRGAKVVALEKPTSNERGEWFVQRYIRHLPDTHFLN